MTRKADKTKVAIHAPNDRPLQLRYFCPIRRKFVKESTGTYDAKEAERQRRQKEAEILTNTVQHRPNAPWETFKRAFQDSEYRYLRDRSQAKLDVVFNAIEKVLKPDVVADLTTDSLVHFRNVFAAGEDKPKDERKVRSPHTIKSYMVAVMGILRWAEVHGYIDRTPLLPKFRGVPKSPMRGRPLSLEEFERMITCTADVTGADAAASWEFVLRGLWFSAFRLEELMNFHWDSEEFIRPIWPRRGFPTIIFPHWMQKNKEHDEIPMLPDFEKLLASVPARKRLGFVFNPISINGKYNRAPKTDRPSAEWVGKIVSRIGEKAGVVTIPARAGEPAKCATAHDLRRSCAQRMEDAGVSPILIARLMRHKSYQTTQRHYTKGSTQKQAEAVRALLDTVSDTVQDSKPRRKRTKRV